MRETQNTPRNTSVMSTKPVTPSMLPQLVTSNRDCMQHSNKIVRQVLVGLDGTCMCVLCEVTICDHKWRHKSATATACTGNQAQTSYHSIGKSARHRPLYAA